MKNISLYFQCVAPQGNSAKIKLQWVHQLSSKIYFRKSAAGNGRNLENTSCEIPIVESEPNEERTFELKVTYRGFATL